jgi:peptide chain release factor 2
VVALEAQVADPALWDDSRRAAALTQELSHIREELAGWEALTRRAGDVCDLADLMGEEADADASSADPAMTTELTAELEEIERELGVREVDLLYSDPYTDNPALLSVKSGAGGTDSQDWAEMLLRMFLRWGERHRMAVEFIEEAEGEEAGIKSATIRVEGRRAFGLLKSERGVHRLVRLSPFDSAHRRHTSFVLVEVTPEVDDDVTVEIDPKDVREDVYRSSGAGGQHVNKTSSAVRLTHIPTGIVVTCQNERSQHQNRDVAWRVLRSRLLAVAQAAHAERISELKGESLPAEWGSQIRSYVLHPYTMVKDHRTAHEVGNVQAVLDGDIDSFQEAYLRWAAGNQDAAAAAAASA